MSGETIHKALAAVMADVGHVAKRDRNEHQRFLFRGIDAVVKAACKDILEGGDPIAARRRMEAAASEHGADLPLIGVPVRDGHGYVMRLAVSA